MTHDIDIFLKPFVELPELPDSHAKVEEPRNNGANQITPTTAITWWMFLQTKQNISRVRIRYYLIKLKYCNLCI